MPKLLYFVTEDWFFCSHFLPMARAAQAVGYDVIVATRVRAHAEQMAAHGLRVISFENERSSLNPLEILRSLIRMVRIVRAEQPDIVHCIALRFVVLGGLAAKLARARKLILAPTGLGYLWIESGPTRRLARIAVRFLVGRQLRGPGTHYLFENTDDLREFGLDPHDPDVTLVGGSGFEPVVFATPPEPQSPPIKVAVVARMLKSKGITESVSAVRRARALGVNVELHLFGSPDPSNRRSLSKADLEAFQAYPGVFWHPSVADITQVWRQHHIAMLLSYREGLPRSLVEAAAMGRPIITTNVAGCRDVVRDEIEGLLVPLGDVEATARALVRLAEEPALRARLGAAANIRFRERFTENAVMQTVKNLYRRLYPATALGQTSIVHSKE